MSRVAIVLGIVVLVIAVAAAPMPLSETLDNSRHVVIYPNLLFAVPLVLVGVLLLHYGLTSREEDHVVE